MSFNRIRRHTAGYPAPEPLTAQRARYAGDPLKPAYLDYPLVPSQFRLQQVNVSRIPDLMTCYVIYVAMAREGFGDRFYCFERRPGDWILCIASRQGEISVEGWIIGIMYEPNPEGNLTDVPDGYLSIIGCP